MIVSNKPLVLDLVEWIALEPRSYASVMTAWRTSCPRLPIWEDALDLGLVQREYRPGRGAMVSVTDAGRALLVSEGREAGDWGIPSLSCGGNHNQSRCSDRSM
jgi:hypothetical protein